MVEKGTAATAPEDPTREGFTFDGWDKDFSNVTSDLTVTAKWKKNNVPSPTNAPISIDGEKVLLSATDFVFNGRIRKPGIKSIGGKALSPGVDYTIKWSNASSKDVGLYTVVIEGKGKYTGSTKATYKIIPKGTKIKSFKKGKKAIVVKWKKQPGKMSKTRINGYQVQLATDNKFTENRKIKTIKGYKKVSKKVTNLKDKTNYYVRVRTYKTVRGVKFYSPWSEIKAVKTK